VIGAADVAIAARETLRTYLPARLALGVGGRAALPAPTSYEMVPTLDAILRVKRSVLAVSVPRMLGTPERFGDGSYDAVFLVSVAVWHEQLPSLPILTAAADYTACVRAVMLSNQNLGGIASQVSWNDESIDLVGDGMTALTMGLGITEFAVRVPQVADEEPLHPVGSEFIASEATVYVNPK
jgi:hypothetical protein